VEIDLGQVTFLNCKGTSEIIVLCERRTASIKLRAALRAFFRPQYCTGHWVVSPA
jgi:hypothetical protein